MVHRALYTTQKGSVGIDVSGSKMLFSSTNGSSSRCVVILGRGMTDDTSDETFDSTAGILFMHSGSEWPSSSSSS